MSTSKTVVCQAPAKLNLGLDVVGMRSDGYHELATVFQTISIYDRLMVTRTDAPASITLHCDTPDVPCDHSNLVWKATERFQEMTHYKEKITITLEKHIPSQAGLGGGSSDAAATLRALQALYENPLSQSQLAKIAVSLGADVPFLLYGGTVYAAGVGEKLESLPPCQANYVVVAKGTAGVSTAQAYQNIDTLKAPQHPPVKALRQAIAEKQPLTKIASLCGNLFEQAVLLEEVDQIRTTMLAHGSLCSVMTGSGAAVFGIFPGKSEAEMAYQALRAIVPFVVVCETTARIPEPKFLI